MPLEIKKLSQVDMTETMSDESAFLVERDGAIKRSEIGSGETVTEDAKVLVTDNGEIKAVPKDAVAPSVPSLPEVDGSGKTLVSVNGEWKQTNGYGYEEPPAFDPIMWDGDTEGRAHIDDYFDQSYVKVSDQVLTSDQIIGATVHFNSNLEAPIPDETITESDIESYGGLLITGYVVTAEAGTYDVDGDSVIIPENGTYFVYYHEEYELYPSSLTASSVIHPIDKKYIPASAKLPDASSLPDGTALVSVNGEWKTQDGYGYFEPLSVISKPRLSLSYNDMLDPADFGYYNAIVNNDFVVIFPDSETCNVHLKCSASSPSFSIDETITMTRDSSGNFSSETVGSLVGTFLLYKHDSGKLWVCTTYSSSIILTTFELSEYGFIAGTIHTMDTKYLPLAPEDGDILIQKNGEWSIASGYGYNNTQLNGIALYADPSNPHKTNWKFVANKYNIPISDVQEKTSFNLNFRYVNNGIVSLLEVMVLLEKTEIQYMGRYTYTGTRTDHDGHTWTFSLSYHPDYDGYILEAEADCDFDYLTILTYSSGLSNNLPIYGYRQINQNYIPDIAPHIKGNKNGTGIVVYNHEFYATQGYGYFTPDETSVLAMIDLTSGSTGETSYSYLNITSDDKVTLYSGTTRLGVMTYDDTTSNGQLTYSDESGFTLRLYNLSYGAFYQKINYEYTETISMGFTTLTVKIGNESETHKFDKSLIPDCLPDYTDADEGKVLKIVDGVPTWVTP